jgi:hypothetical protein
MIMGWQICKVLKLVAISTLPPAQTRTRPQGEEDLQEGLRAYPSLMDGLNPPRAQQRSTVHGNVDSQSSRGPFWSDEAAKQTNLYQHSNDKQPPLTQSDSSQRTWFQPNNAYRPRPTPTQQPNAQRAPAFREGWDPRPARDPDQAATIDPTPDLSRPPTYNTSGKEHSAQEPRRD